METLRALLAPRTYRPRPWAPTVGLRLLPLLVGCALLFGATPASTQDEPSSRASSPSPELPPRRQAPPPPAVKGGHAFPSDDASAAVSKAAADRPPGMLVVTIKGRGTVTSSPGGIWCREGMTRGCEAMFAPGSGVTLTLVPDAGYRVTAGCPVLETQCTVVRTTTARTRFDVVFEPTTAQVIVHAAAGGTVRVDGHRPCSAPRCEYSLPWRKPATFVAAAPARLRFREWGGACQHAGSDPRCVVSLERDATIDARFEPTPIVLGITSKSGVIVTVTPSGGLAEGRCRGECEAFYLEATAVMLEARAEDRDAGFVWLGCDEASGRQCRVRVTARRDVSVASRTPPGLASQLLEATMPYLGAMSGAAAGVAAGVFGFGFLARRWRRRRALATAEDSRLLPPSDAGEPESTALTRRDIIGKVPPLPAPTNPNVGPAPASTVADWLTWLRRELEDVRAESAAAATQNARHLVAVQTLLHSWTDAVVELRQASGESSESLRDLQARIESGLLEIEMALQQSVADMEPLRRELVDLRAKIERLQRGLGARPAPRRDEPETPRMAVAIPRWLSSLLRSAPGPAADASDGADAYVRLLRDCVTTSRRLAEGDREPVYVDLAHLTMLADDRFTVSTVAVPDDPSRPLHCELCERVPGAMTYQHVVGVRNADGSEVAVFLPAGGVVGRHLWPRGFKQLLDDAPDAPLLRVTAVEQPARLTRGFGDGDAYRVSQPMRLALAP